MHLTGVLLAVIALAAKKAPLVVPSIVLYAVAVIAAVAVYIRGLRLAKEHPQRETCELLGAAGFIGILSALVIGIATALGPTLFQV